MTKFGIAIYDRSLKWPIRKLVKSIRSKGHKAFPFRLSDVSVEIGSTDSIHVKDLDLLELDILFLRTLGSGNCDQITFRISLLDHLERNGVRVINPTYPFRHAKDKYISLVLLRKAGLPIIDTFITENQEEGYKAARRYQDSVIKPLIGSQGLGVVHAENPDIAFRTIKMISSLGQVSYIQRYIEKKGQDLRVFVINGEVIAAMARRGVSWKTNISQGAKPVKIEIDDSLKSIAIDAVEVIGLEYAGVDILTADGTPYIIEVNAAPSWRGLQEATGIPIADLLVEYALTTI
ncbi:MAG: RimK family alpha-L-glutamate ligase [Candidatus Ranarchaeia archaeon]